MASETASRPGASLSQPLARTVHDGDLRLADSEPTANGVKGRPEVYRIDDLVSENPGGYWGHGV